MTTTKTALVTGGNRGLGRSSVLHLARDGMDVVLTYRSNPDEAAAVVAEVEALGRRAVALELDTTKTDTFAAFGETVRTTLRETFDRDDFDVLVNNAGAAAWTPLGQIEEVGIAQMVGVHFTGVVLLTQELVGSIVDGGRIINTSTGLARFVGQSGYSVYASMKGAVEVYDALPGQRPRPASDHRQRRRTRCHRHRLRRRVHARRRPGARRAVDDDRDGPRR